MAITSQDIHNQSFSVDRKGYDIDEVDVFLDHVAEEIDGLNSEISRLENELADAQTELSNAQAIGAEVAFDSAVPNDEDAATVRSAAHATSESSAKSDARIAELEAQLAEKRADDNAISQALIVAQRSADDIIAKANSQASDAIDDARAEANRIVARANSEKQEILESINKLQSDREDAREDYADILRDLITDATNKLNLLGYDASFNSGELVLEDTDYASKNVGAGMAGKTGAANMPNAYVNNAYPDYVPAGNYSPMDSPSDGSGSQTVPYEKDFSGYGDAEESFDDID